MILIAHRGNLNGIDKSTENSPEHIQKCIELGYDVEIDLRNINGEYFLGHDNPDYKIDLEWMYYYSNNLWIHCKNNQALFELSMKPTFNYFWHNIDDFTLTRRGYIWTYPDKELTTNSVCVLPEWNIPVEELTNFHPKCYGICSDYISLIA